MRRKTPKIAPSPSRICTPSNTWFLGPTRLSPPNGISIDSAVFAGLVNANNTHSQTDIQTDKPRYSICSNRKGKEEYLYSATYTTHSLKSPRHGHTVSPTNYNSTPCLPFFVSVHQMAPPLTQVSDIQLKLTFIDPEENKRLSWPGWLTYRTVCPH